MLRCKSCKKIIGMEVEIHKTTYGYSQKTTHMVTGIYTKPSGKKALDLDEICIEYSDTEITYECDFCGQSFSEQEVIAIMEELAELDKEEK